MDFKDTPILIICRDRVSCLKQQIEAFEKRGYKNIILVDNASTYEPLLEYYKTLPYEIIRMSQNYGHTVLLDKGILYRFAGAPYVYTDPDIVPIEECPDNFLEYFHEVLSRNPEITKVGFGLKIDDLPDHFIRKEEVIGWEKQYWINRLGQESNVWLAPIDTTFALCRPGITSIVWQWAGRTDFPYLARHTAWYLDVNNLPEEEKYYTSHAGMTTHWTKFNQGSI